MSRFGLEGGSIMEQASLLKVGCAVVTMGLAALACVAASQQAVAQEVPIDRTVLPIRQPVYPPVTELDARNVKAAAVLSGQGASQRPERPDRSDRRHGVWSVERLWRPGPHADGRGAWRTKVSASTSSTRRRYARRPARPCSPAATTTSTTWARSPRRRPPSRGTQACGLTASPRSPRCFA